MKKLLSMGNVRVRGERGGCLGPSDFGGLAFVQKKIIRTEPFLPASRDHIFMVVNVISFA